HEHAYPTPEEPVESASTSTSWNRDLRRPEEPSTVVAAWTNDAPVPIETHSVLDQPEVAEPEPQREPTQAEPSFRREKPVFAEPGTMVEETIDEEEADTVQYHASSDEGYDEFEEETRAADGHLN